MTKKQTKNKKDNKTVEQQLETKRKEELNMTKTLDEIQKEFETLLMKNKKDIETVEHQLETKRKEELNMTKTLDEIQKEFETLLTKKQKDIETVEQKLEIKQKELNELKGDLEKAEQSINISEFEKINKKLWVVEQTTKMLTRKLHQLKNEPIITKEQFNKYEDEIQKSFQLERKEPRKTFETLKPTLAKIIVEEMETRVKAQHLLDDLMSTLAKNNREYLRGENGAYRSFSSSLENDNTTLSHEVRDFARCALD